MKTPKEVMKDALLAYAAKGYDMKTACDRLGVSEAMAKDCGLDESHFQMMSAAETDRTDFLYQGE